MKAFIPGGRRDIINKTYPSEALQFEWARKHLNPEAFGRLKRLHRADWYRWLFGGRIMGHFGWRRGLAPAGRGTSHRRNRNRLRRGRIPISYDDRDRERATRQALALDTVARVNQLRWFGDLLARLRLRPTRRVACLQ